MAEIKSLRGDMPEGSGIVSQVVVDQLEDLLERAKRGEIVALGFFGVKPNRAIFSGWHGASDGYFHQLVASINIVQYRMMRMNVPEENELALNS